VFAWPLCVELLPQRLDHMGGCMGGGGWWLRGYNPPHPRPPLTARPRFSYYITKCLLCAAAAETSESEERGVYKKRCLDLCLSWIWGSRMQTPGPPTDPQPPNSPAASQQQKPAVRQSSQQKRNKKCVFPVRRVCNLVCLLP